MIIHFEPQQILTALILSFVMLKFYFKLADRYNIIDKPNQRSSHTQITLRGAGINFLVIFSQIEETAIYPTKTITIDFY